MATTTVSYNLGNGVLTLYSESVFAAKSSLYSLAENGLLKEQYVCSFRYLVDDIMSLLAAKYSDKLSKTCPNGTARFGYCRRLICNIFGLIYDNGLVVDGISRTNYSRAVNDGKRCTDVLDYRDERIYPTELNKELLHILEDMIDAFKNHCDRVPA